MENRTFSNLNILETAHYTNATRFDIITANIKIWFICYILLCAAGIILNAGILLVIYRQPKLRSRSGFLIAHNQVLDFILGSVIFPLTASPLFARWTGLPLPVIQCEWVHFLEISLVQIGYWVSLFLGVNRFVALLFPHQYARIVTKRALTFSIAFSWILGLGCTTPKLIGKLPGPGRTPALTCISTRIADPMVLEVTMTLGAYLPIGALGLLYAIIFFHTMIKLKQNRVNVAAGAQGTQTKTIRKKMAKAKFLFASYIWTSVCSQVPGVLIALYPQVWRSNVMLPYWMRFLLVTGCTANPVFFVFLSEDYRTAAKRLCNDMAHLRFRKLISVDNQWQGPTSDRSIPDWN